jgi:hypothetical protein
MIPAIHTNAHTTWYLLYIHMHTRHDTCYTYICTHDMIPAIHTNTLMTWYLLYICTHDMIPAIHMHTWHDTCYTNTHMAYLLRHPGSFPPWLIRRLSARRLANRRHLANRFCCPAISVSCPNASSTKNDFMVRFGATWLIIYKVPNLMFLKRAFVK